MTNLTICHDGDRPSQPRGIAPMRRHDTPGAIHFVDAVGPTADTVAQAPETAYRPGLPIAWFQGEPRRVVQS